jgi:outer membrane lipoprotein LolB
MRALIACCALLALAACQSLPPTPSTPWPERRAALQALGQYGFSGQFAAATATDGFSAAIEWQQQGAVSEVALRAPFGVGGARLNYDGSELHVTDSHGTQLDGAAARREMQRLFGFEPPLSSLRYWLLGVPDPATAASETLDDRQRLARLQQDDWQVDYVDYLRTSGQAFDQWLPRRLTLHRGPVRLKLQVSRWQL